MNIARALASLLIMATSVLALAQGSRPTVAVVLSGGGAKGMGHIGALQVMEEAGIPIDMVVGTSMGSIVGGLYSIGYTAAQLDTMVRHQDWEYLLTDKVAHSQTTIEERRFAEDYLLKFELQPRLKDTRIGGLIRGDNLRTLFGSLTFGYNDSVSFDVLPRRFACVATDIVTGGEYVFHSGVLSQAMRASMSIPGAFEPVLYGDKLLVDGGMKNNFPVDVAKAMGADIVIGLTVQEEKLKTAHELTRPGDVLSQLIKLTTRNKYETNVELTDVLIRIPTAGYGTASFTAEAIDSLIRMGRSAALEHWDALATLSRSLAAYGVIDAEHSKPLALQDSFQISAIAFEGITDRDVRMIRQKSGLPEHGTVAQKSIVGTIDLIRSAGNYNDVTYTLTADSTTGGNNLTFRAERKYDKMVRVGMHFDTEDIATIMLRGSFRFRTKIPTSLGIEARLGKRYSLSAKYIIEPVSLRRIEAGYALRHNDFNVYSDGDRVYNVSYNENRVLIALSDYWFRNLAYSVGVQASHIHLTDAIASGSAELAKRNYFYVSYSFRLCYNSLDSEYFPTRGAVFDAGFTLYTDDFLRMKDAMPPSAVSAFWRRAIALSRSITLMPVAHTRMLFGKNIPLFYTNVFGSHFPGYYLSHQIPFAGINTIEVGNYIFVKAGANLRKRIANKHYVSLYADYGATCRTLSDFTPSKVRHLLGAGISYEISTPLGLLGAYLGYYNKAEKLNLYISLGANL